MQSSSRDSSTYQPAQRLEVEHDVAFPDLCIFAGKSGSMVQFMFLPLLEDFDAAGAYSWIWAWYRFPHIAPCRLLRQPIAGGPLITCWRDAFTVREISTHVLHQYRYSLDRKTFAQVVWQPYSTELIEGLPLYCSDGAAILQAVVPLICFFIVEMHHPNRVQ